MNKIVRRYSCRFHKSHFKSVRSHSSNGGEVPSSADVVIIGGGSLGVSTLYHMAKMGVNAIIVEKDQITAGTTWHSAGLVWRLRPNDTEIMLINDTRELARKGGTLETETGLSTGWNENGGLFIANTEERLNEYRRLNTIGRYFDVESTMLSPLQTKQLYPLMNVDDVIGALYSPGDGTVEPSDYVSTLSRAAKKHGGKIYEGIAVTGFETQQTSRSRPLISRVLTTAGPIETNRVVLCGGVWSRDLGAQIGANVPLIGMRHAYVLTDKIEGIRTLPNVRDHDLSIYLRVQGESLQVGGYERNPVFWENVEKDFAFSLFDLDYDVFGVHLENGAHRVPVLEQTGIKSEVCGPESFTADHKPLMGETPEIEGFFLGCGFNSSGMMLGGGCGKQLAKWVIHGQPDYDMFSYDIRRFHRDLTDNDEWIRQRSHESYAKNYSIVFPKDEPLACREMRRSHLHDLLVEQGCVFQERHGFERPGWFSSNEILPELLDYDYYGAYGHTVHDEYEYRDRLQDDYTFDFPYSHEAIGQEAIACRERVAVFDQSYFGKFFLKGPQALQAIEFIATNVMDKPIGSTTYTEMCTPSGKVACDLGVSRIGENEFYITAGGMSCTHDYGHIMGVIDRCGYDCKLEDRSDEFGMFSVMGPHSRDVLSALTDSSLSNEDFPFATNQLIELAGHEVRAIRLTFVGELGWELHVPRESCVPVYKAVMKEGEKYRIRNAGYRAIDALSAQKGYLHWHEDVRPDDTPLEAGVGFVCKLKTEIPFQGREALEEQKEAGLKRRLVHVRVGSDVKLHGLETIWRNDVCVGYLRRADFDFTENQSIGFGYIVDPDGGVVSPKFVRGAPKENIPAPYYELEVLGKKIPATVSLKTPFDPKSERVQGNYPVDAVADEN